MEYVLNYTSYTSDTSGQSDRRMRPHSAFAPTRSYYQQKVDDDDLARPILQHKPLAKGEFTQFTLSKVFDDPGMRPKVFVPASVNKASYGLVSSDIAGATPQYKCAPYRARDTDPNAPRYLLPGNSVTPEVAAAVAAAAAEAAASATSDGAPPSSSSSLTPRQRVQPQQQPSHWQQQSQQTPGPRPVTTTVRDTLNVSDINAVSSVAERPSRLETRHTQLNTRDVEGSWPGWEPHFRAHVGKNLRDPGLDVRDISGSRCRRRVFSARPSVGNIRGGGGGGGAAATAAAAPTAPTAEGRQLQQTQSYLPPPLTWQPVQSDSEPTAPRRSGGDGSSSGSGEATRRHGHPARQQSASSQPPEQQQQQPLAGSQPSASVAQYAAGEWPSSVTLPLRPALQPPPFATYIPTGSVAAVLSASLDPATVSRTAPVADHPATTVGSRTPGKGDPKARHSAKVTLADSQRAEAAEAARVIASLRPSREAVEEFYSSCRRLDRETCGKVTPTDFMHALERANLLSATSTSTSTAAAEPAAAVTLARGLQDGSGMVSYRYLARALLDKSTAAARRPSPAAPVAPAVTSSAAPAAPAVPAPPTAPAAPTAPAVPAPPPTAATADAGPAPSPRAARDAGSQPTPARQSSDVAQSGGGAAAAAAKPAPAAAAPSESAENDGGNNSGFMSAAAVAVAAAVAAGTPRRSVNWAPESPPADADVSGGQGSAADAPRPPPTPFHPPEDAHRLERQERQLRREGSPKRRPYSAAPGGSGGGPKGASAVAAVFKMLGAPQPILYDTPAPAPAQSWAAAAAEAVAAAAASGSSSTQALAGTFSTVASAAAPPAGRPIQRVPDAAASAAAAAAAGVPHDGMGFGPHWPPEPLPSTLQKRSSLAIMESAAVQLRDVCDSTYYPFKNQTLWFTGREGGEAVPGGQAEAALAYQPSVDPTSFIVGKGHHRVTTFAPSGHKLEPEVEAAIVAKLRPRSALAERPEVTTRLRTASSVVSQLNADNPLLYPGTVDPTTPAGAALKGLLGCLYSTGSTNGAGGASGANCSPGRGAAGAGRPSTAGPLRRSTHLRASSVTKSLSAGLPGGGGGAAGGGGGAAGGGGAVRVGRAALERQMHREDVAAVRHLC